MSTKLAKIIADFRTTLATEIAVGGTTGTLQSILDDDGVSLPTGTYFFTLDNGNSSKEHIVCTCTAGALTAISSITRQGVQASGVVRKHRIGASVTITDFAHIMYINDLLTGATDLDHLTPLKYDGTATISNSNHLATKAYVDGVAVAGAPDASTTVKGNVEIATGAELAAGTGTGGTGAVIVPAGSSFKNSSAGSGDANKVPVLDANGLLDNSFLQNPLSRTADQLQITTDPDSANDPVRLSYIQQLIKNATLGDGSDGAFAQSSGTTTWNTAGKNVYRFTSFSLTGTANLAFGSNLQNVPIIVFVQGDLTITASGTSINAKGMGGQLGAGGTGGGTGGAGTAGTSGSTAPSANFGGGGSAVAADNHAGNGGGGGGGYGNAGATGTPSAGGTGGAGGASWSLYNVNFPIAREIANAFIGGGGGGGGGAKETGNTNNAKDGGPGGNGGGCVIFIVGGNINLTTGTIDVSGNNGSNGVNATDYGGGGGGGGGGGFFGCYYVGSVTANTITITKTGGTGGSGGTGGTAGGAGGNGGAGQSEVRQISEITKLV